MKKRKNERASNIQANKNNLKHRENRSSFSLRCGKKAAVEKNSF